MQRGVPYNMACLMYVIMCGCMYVLVYLCMWSDVWRGMFGVCDVLCRLCRDSSLHFGTHWPTPLRGLREGSLPRDEVVREDCSPTHPISWLLQQSFPVRNRYEPRQQAFPSSL